MAKIPQITGSDWLNIEKPLTPEELSGKIVLVDFFTYSCVNCLRTIPHLRELWKRYKNLPFLLIGVHTPEFEFEKNIKNVTKAIRELKIDWPVVLDNNQLNWNNFANHYWPAKYLFDQNGYLVYEHFGEGAYAETEKQIQSLLRKNFGIANFPKVVAETESVGAFCSPFTPELYCGYDRGIIANDDGYHFEHLAHYQLPENIPTNMMALVGDFLAKSEYIESFSEQSRLIVHFQGAEVNLVLAPVEERAIIGIEYNNEKIPDDISGEDLDQGDAIIAEPRMYNLLKSNLPLEGNLSIVIKGGNIRAYAFTFSGCQNK